MLDLTTPLAADAPELRTLGSALERAGFTTAGVEAALDTATLSARPSDLLVARRRIADRDDAFATLARLFLLGVEQHEDAVAAAVAPLAPDELVRIGLAVRTGRTLRGTARVVPHGDLYVIADLDRESPDDTPADYVAGVQAPSVTLAKLAVRRPASRALDLGTGCGIQALLAAAHAEEVVGTDVNARALNFAAAAATLNGVGNVEWRLGNAFEPVAGERFDLIVANPPYVISPESSYAYRDSGLPGDSISREVVQAVPEHLAEGGFAHVLVSWITEPGGDWDAPLRPWVEGSGCDAWLLHYRTEDPLSHSSKWLRPLSGDADAFAGAVDRWLDYLRELGAEAIAYGAVVLRRRSGGANWVRVDEFPIERLQPAGEHVSTVFHAQDRLEEDGDEWLLSAPLALDERHVIRSELEIRDGRLLVDEQTLRLTHGLQFDVGLDPTVISLLPLLDGGASVGSVLERAAGAAGADPERFVRAALPVVRRLFQLGFLLEPR